MLNPTGGNRKSLLPPIISFLTSGSSANLTFFLVGGKCGYVWGATGFLCLVTAYFHLPEMKGRSYREIDILFKRKVDARHWKEQVVDINDDE